MMVIIAWSDGEVGEDMQEVVPTVGAEGQVFGPGEKAVLGGTYDDVSMDVRVVKQSCFRMIG